MIEIILGHKIILTNNFTILENRLSKCIECNNLFLRQGEKLYKISGNTYYVLEDKLTCNDYIIKSLIE